MNVAILSSRPGWHTNDLVRAFSDAGHRAVVCPIASLEARIGSGSRLRAGAVDLSECDAVLLRTIPLGSLEQIIFRIDALHRLERLGVPVFNPARVVEKTVDKFYTSCLLEEAGIPTPPTVIVERMDDAMDAFREMGDVIVKPLFGSNGRGIVRVSDEELAYRVFRALELERAVYYIQKTIAHPGKDLRVFVVGGRIVASIWRSSDSWRTNISRGARADVARLTAEWEQLSLAAAEVVGADYAGVDLLPASDGSVTVLEVNGSPGWRALQPASGIDIAAAIVAHVASVADARRGGR